MPCVKCNFSNIILLKWHDAFGVPYTVQLNANNASSVRARHAEGKSRTRRIADSFSKISDELLRRSYGPAGTSYTSHGTKSMTMRLALAYAS